MNQKRGETRRGARHGRIDARRRRWWRLRARSRAIGFCHVSVCIRHSDHPEFVASRRDQASEPDLEFVRPCISASYRDRAVSPCDSDTVKHCTHECVPTLTRQTTAFPSLRKHSFCPRRHPLRPGRRLFAPNSRVSRQSFQTSGPICCLSRAVNIVDRSQPEFPHPRSLLRQLH